MGGYLLMVAVDGGLQPQQYIRYRGGFYKGGSEQMGKGEGVGLGKIIGGGEQEVSISRAAAWRRRRIQRQRGSGEGGGGGGMGTWWGMRRGQCII